MNGWFDDWRGYGESLRGLTVSTMKPLWLQHGGMHSRWWACLDLNQGLLLPKMEDIIPGYAAAMREALDEGALDDLARMLDLLAALGGPR